MGKQWKQWQTLFRGSKITADGDCSHEIKRHLLLGRKAMTNLDSILKGRDITFPTKVRLVKAMVFFSSHVWMWELDYKENWVLKNWWFWMVMVENTLASPLDCREIQPVYPKQNQSWIFIGKDPDARKDWRQEEKGNTEMVGWHHWLDGHELEQAPRVGDGPGSLESFSPWGHKESDMTEWLNWTYI